jgi:NADP-dependent aldehyde dehydrogenase
MTPITRPDDIDRALQRATTAAARLRVVPDRDRADHLDAAADALDGNAAELVDIAAHETHLDRARLVGEVARTTGQLRMFSAVVRDGSYLEATLDSADPHATPPRPDLRRMLVPLGPIVNFAASNFPFAFSVAGGDTAAALAAACPVIVKAHEGHPLLSRRTAEILTAAFTAIGAPDDLVQVAEGRETGVALVRHPEVKAATFTGSTRVGRVLFDAAASRPDPIPFYGELGSVNPVVVTPGADAARAPALAVGLASSFTLGGGQFCTKPGIVFVPTGSRIPQLVVDGLPSSAPWQLLTDSIDAGFDRSWHRLVSATSTEVILPASTRGSATAGVARVSLDDFVADPELRDEVFGPAVLLVEYRDLDDVRAALALLQGSLTGTVHAEPGEETTDIVEALASIAGRILFDGWPTGVAVTWSQHHGGPWPATTSIFTSVGATAIRRFQRPLVFQSAPDGALPEPLRDDNPWKIPRRVDGTLALPF